MQKVPECIVAPEIQVLLLKRFDNVLLKELRGKDYTYTIKHEQEVADKILDLWMSRGYCPSRKGVAILKYTGNNKPYFFPAYFWSE